MRNRKLILCTTAIALSVTSSIALAVTNGMGNFDKTLMQKDQPVFIEADQVDYDIENKIVAAGGKVEILKGETVMFADNVKYDQANNLVYAEGNVVVTGPDGNTIFTDKFVLKDDFKEGVIKYFRARLSDGSLIAAAEAKRFEGNKVEMKRAVYSPCKICTGTDEDPLWQLKAENVLLDEGEQKVTYDDAYLEVYGVPVLYTPYFSHPTPDADPKSGILTPKLRTDGNLGVAVTVPYYWNITPTMDVTFEPVITSKEGVVAAGQFRHILPYGQYQFYGSITRPRGFTELTDSAADEKDVRGHLQGHGLFDLTENWDFGFDANFASDDTYLRRYNYGSQDLLTSRAYFERIDNRDYSIIQTVHFQGLLADDNNREIPLVLPYTRNHYETSKGIIPGFSGSYAYGDLTGFMVDREVNDESRRVSMTTGVMVPFITAGGHVFESQISVRGDYFNIDDVNDDTYSKNRVIPEASIGWRYPLVNSLPNGGSIYLEPVAKIIVSPNHNYNKNIPNEDSQDIEYSDLNVFSNNRFRGIDRVESGTRMQYGLQGGYYDKDVTVSAVLGQSYNFSKMNYLPANTGLEDNFSDYVGRLSVNFYNTLDFAYRFRVDSDKIQFRRNELDASLDYKPVHLNINYLYLDYDYTNPTDNREEISAIAKFDITDEWSLLANGRRNLSANSNIDASLGVGYENECVNAVTMIKRSYLSDRDAKAGTSINFLIGLKNLGEL